MMKKRRYPLALLLAGIFIIVPNANAKSAAFSDAQIKEKIIQSSINAYPGNCPYPYNLARNGSRCGKRSAWNRRGGYAPVCYQSKVSDEMVRAWRKKH